MPVSVHFFPDKQSGGPVWMGRSMSILRKSTVSFVLLIPLLILHLDVFGESPHKRVSRKAMGRIA